MPSPPLHLLHGRWALRRTGGLLPPLGLLHKRISGGRGETRLGPLGLPFEVREGPDGPELAYTGLLRPVRDRLTRDPGGGWQGRTRVFGVPVGRFRMTRPGRPRLP